MRLNWKGFNVSRPNPYEAPSSATAATLQFRSDLNIIRSTSYVLLTAVIGFLIPYAIAFGLYVFATLFSFAQSFEDLRKLFITFLMPALGCCLLFGLGGIVDASSKPRIGLLRSIMFVGIAMLGGLFAMAITTNIFGLGRRTRAYDPWSWHKLAIFVTVPVTYTVFHAIANVFRKAGTTSISASNTPSGSANQGTTDA